MTPASMECLPVAEPAFDADDRCEAGVDRARTGLARLEALAVTELRNARAARPGIPSSDPLLACLAWDLELPG